MVKGKPDISVILPKFLEFVGDLPVVAHNAKFDYNFIKKACEPYNLEFNNTCIDTLELSKHLFTEIKKYPEYWGHLSLMFRIFIPNV